MTSDDGTPIWYSDSRGNGPTVILLHGLTMTSVTNFERCYGVHPDGRVGVLDRPSIHDRLCAAGLRVIGIDARGHGRSGRSRDPGRYSGEAHARDVIAVIDAEELVEVDVVGYSMGSITATRLFGVEPRLRSVALCGTRPPDGWDDVAWDVLADCFWNGSWAEHPEMKVWRAQARLDDVHDFESLGAAVAGIEPPPVERLERPPPRVLVLNGGADDDDHAAARLAGRIPGAQARVVGVGDHALACSDPTFQQALVEFLAADASPTVANG